VARGEQNVNGAGYQFLTGTALTVNQNGAGGDSDGTPPSALASRMARLEPMILSSEL